MNVSQVINSPPQLRWPVQSTQSTPFTTPRVSAHGRPRPSARTGGRNSGSRTADCLSVRSKVDLARRIINRAKKSSGEAWTIRR